MHVAYDSRQFAYPEPILLTSLNRAVARTIALRDIFDVSRTVLFPNRAFVFALRATRDTDAGAFAARTRVRVLGTAAVRTAEDIKAPRDVTPARVGFTRTRVGPDTARRDTLSLLYAAARELVAESVDLGLDAFVGAYAPCATPHVTNNPMKQENNLPCDTKISPFWFNYNIFLQFESIPNLPPCYSMQQLTAFLTQSPNLRTVDLDSDICFFTSFSFFGSASITDS